MDREPYAVTVNGTEHELVIEPRLLLSDVLRDELGLTGTKRGCDTGKCGACTVLLDGKPVKSCNLLALQTADSDVTTVEGLTENDELTHLQQAFWDKLAFQCGFCTPGLLMNSAALLEANSEPTEEEIRTHIAGNICRCTGYDNIVDAISEAAERRGRKQ